MFQHEIAQLIAKSVHKEKCEILALIEIPPDSTMGDYAFPCFRVSKDPTKKALSLAEELKELPFLAKIQANGPYLNFFIDKAVLASNVLRQVEREGNKYGSGKGGKKIVVEYCGPNTNKPLHLGHLRNMALGSAMCRVLSFFGHTVKPVNIVNDRGIHISQSMLAYQKWGKGKQPNKKSDHFVGDYYVLFAQHAAQDEGLKKEAQKLLVKWEEDDKETRALWRKMNDWVLDGFKDTYYRFGVSFDKEYFESDYYEKGKGVVLDGLKKKVFMKNEDGAIIAPLESFKLTDKIVLRGDGTSIYITQDMYLAQKRYEDYKYDAGVYVVASEQRLHFQQLFAILKLLKRPFADKLYHLSYGLVKLPSGRMKSREGTVVDADDLMDEVVGLARKEVTRRYDSLSAKDKTKRAEHIGIGALKFFLLRVDGIRDMIFDPEESIQFDGETGPYVQYAHARACSILRKAHAKPKNVDYALLNEIVEHKVITLLAGFAGVVKDTASHYKPHILCRYLLDLAQAFNEFYHAHHVVSEDKKLMNARLVLVDAVRQVLTNGLQLLGIEAMDEM
jgi:arginyl-tRNA synthetase